MEPLLRPPVGTPAALRWIRGKEQLLVANQDGELFLCDRSGTHRLGRGLPEPRALDVHPDGRVLTVSRTRWRIASPYQADEGTHDVRAHAFGVLTPDGALVVGDDEQDRRVLWVVADGRATRKALPPGATVLPGPAVCQSTPAGLLVTPLGAAPAPEHTTHRLRTAGQVVLGFTRAAVTLWGPGGTPYSVKLMNVTAADVLGRGELLAVGTHRGAVALVDPMRGRKAEPLIRAHRDPVVGVALSGSGRYLATAAEQLRIWQVRD